MGGGGEEREPATHSKNREGTDPLKCPTSKGRGMGGGGWGMGVRIDVRVTLLTFN